MATHSKPDSAISRTPDHPHRSPKSLLVPVGRSLPVRCQQLQHRHLHWTRLTWEPPTNCSSVQGPGRSSTLSTAVYRVESAKYRAELVDGPAPLLRSPFIRTSPPTLSPPSGTFNGKSCSKTLQIAHPTRPYPSPPVPSLPPSRRRASVVVGPSNRPDADRASTICETMEGVNSG